MRPGWFTVNPDSGVCAPHASSDIVFTFDAAELDAGQYYAFVVINNSDPFRPTVVIPIHLTVSGGVDVSGDATGPLAYDLEQNFPNPFNPITTIRYSLPRRSHVTLSVFNTLGQQVAILRNGEQEAGYHDVQFDGSGRASGVYFYRMVTGGFRQTRHFVLMK
jgi:hypothetical protein